MKHETVVHLDVKDLWELCLILMKEGRKGVMMNINLSGAVSFKGTHASPQEIMTRNRRVTHEDRQKEFVQLLRAHEEKK